MPYVNPIPAIDVGKKFEMSLALRFDEPVPVEDAKLRTARYILEQSPETIASWLHCAKTYPMYPDDLTPEQMDEFGLRPDGGDRARGEEDG